MKMRVRMRAIRVRRGIYSGRSGGRGGSGGGRYRRAMYMGRSRWVVIDTVFHFM